MELEKYVCIKDGIITSNKNNFFFRYMENDEYEISYVGIYEIYKNGEKKMTVDKLPYSFIPLAEWREQKILNILNEE